MIVLRTRYLIFQQREEGETGQWVPREPCLMTACKRQEGDGQEVGVGDHRRRGPHTPREVQFVLGRSL